MSRYCLMWYVQLPQTVSDHYGNKLTVAMNTTSVTVPDIYVYKSMAYFLLGLGQLVVVVFSHKNLQE